MQNLILRVHAYTATCPLLILYTALEGKDGNLNNAKPIQFSPFSKEVSETNALDLLKSAC